MTNPLAANRTAHRPLPTSHSASVEDLGWPAVRPTPPSRKPVRPVRTWVPGPNGQWEGVTPTLQ